MENRVSKLLTQYESGALSRRELVAALTSSLALGEAGTDRVVVGSGRRIPGTRHQDCRIGRLPRAAQRTD